MALPSLKASLMVDMPSLTRTPPCRAGVKLGVHWLPPGRCTAPGSGFLPSLPVTDPIRSQTRPHLHTPWHSLQQNQLPWKRGGERKQHLVFGACGAGRARDGAGHHGTVSCTPRSPGRAPAPGTLHRAHRSPAAASHGKKQCSASSGQGGGRSGAGGDTAVPPPARCSPRPGQELSLQGSLGRIYLARGRAAAVTLTSALAAGHRPPNARRGAGEQSSMPPPALRARPARPPSPYIRTIERLP